MFGVGGPPGPFSIPHYTAAKHGEFSIDLFFESSYRLMVYVAVVGLTKMVSRIHQPTSRV